jgi:hypothetical protein
VLIEQAEKIGEPPDDPLLLFSTLYGLWASNMVAFNGDACRDLAAQFLTLAKKQKDTVPLMVGYRVMGSSLLFSGDVAEGRTHLNRAVALYNADIHRPLASRFGQDIRVIALIYRALALWFLGFPDAALTDAGQVVSQARAINQAATLMVVRHRTLQRGSRALPSRIASSLLRILGSSLAICSSLRTSAHATSRASQGRCGHGLRCDRLQSKAVSMLSTPAVSHSL